MPSSRSPLILVLLLSLAALGRAEDWPQWFGPRRDGVWREPGIFDRFPEGGPRVVWRQPIASGYAGAAIAHGKCYVLDREQKIGPDGKRIRDDKNTFVGQERIHCFDAATGKPLWTHAYDCPYSTMGGYPEGPRTTPSIHEGKLYSLGAMGDLVCLDADSGKLLWSKNVAEEYKAKHPVWGYSASTLVDGDHVFVLVGAPDAAVVAFHKDNGKEVWKGLNVEEIGYAPPIVIQAGGVRQLIVWHTESVNGLDPVTGKLYWTHAFPTGRITQRPAITVATPRLVGDVLYLSCPYFGCLALQMEHDRPAVKQLWAGKSRDLAKTDGLHCLMGTPAIKDGYLYGVCNAGELRCLNAATGERIWETYDATDGKKAFLAHAFVIEHESRFFIFNDHGDLIIANLSPKGYEEISRAKIIEPTILKRDRTAVWAHPAFANRCVYVRNDKEIICLSLAAT